MHHTYSATFQLGRGSSRLKTPWGIISGPHTSSLARWGMQALTDSGSEGASQ